jgi:copper(I)-binding protein
MGQPRTHHPARWAATGIACAVALGACDAGMDAETSQETPDVAGVDGSVGEVSLDDVFLEADGTVEAGGTVPLRGALTNDAEQADQLVRVTTPAAQSVQLLDQDGQVSAAGVELPAAGSVDATTGAVRMRLEGVTDAIPTTDTVPVTFVFETAGQVRLDVPVAPPS